MAGKLTAAEKADRARERMIEQSRQWQVGTYTRKFVAPLFQKMIRAEFAALPAIAAGVGTLHSAVAKAVVNTEITDVEYRLGQCVCVTCGTVGSWKGTFFGGGEIETGHFLASRRNSILLEEDNVAPQCKTCNRHRAGEQQLFRKWMLAVRGPEVVERLERLKNGVVQFTREQLVDMRIAYAARLKAAEEKMKGV